MRGGGERKVEAGNVRAAALEAGTLGSVRPGRLCRLRRQAPPETLQMTIQFWVQLVSAQPKPV